MSSVFNDFSFSHWLGLHNKSIHISSSKKFRLFYTKNLLFFILHHHFYKTPTSVHLFYHLSYLNNQVSLVFYYFPPNPYTRLLTRFPSSCILFSDFSLSLLSLSLWVISPYPVSPLSTHHSRASLSLSTHETLF